MKSSPNPPVRVWALLFLTVLFGASVSLHHVQAAIMPQAESIITFVNQARVQNGLQPLVENSALMQAAATKSQGLAAQGILVHTSAPQGVAWAPIVQVGYAYSSIGENLAANILNASTLVGDWMNSPSHRANILNTRYRDIGIGVAQGVYDGIMTDFVVLYAAEPKPLAKTSVTLPKIVSVVNPMTNAAEIRSMLSLLTKYLLALTAQKAEASDHL